MHFISFVGSVRVNFAISDKSMLCAMGLNNLKDVPGLIEYLKLKLNKFIQKLERFSSKQFYFFQAETRQRLRRQVQKYILNDYPTLRI